MRWTPAQDEYLMEHAHEGAEAVRRGMAVRFGVLRSTAAVISHGTRIGASWRRYEVCPQCGEPARKLNVVTGLCEACQKEHLAREKSALRQRMEDNRRRFDAARRAYDADRQAVQRHRKAMGAVDGEKVGMPKKMPNACSGQMSFFEEGEK